MSAMTEQTVSRRKYGFCAKGLDGSTGHLHMKVESTNYVCDEHRGTPGYYLGCASCGTAWSDGESRDYVCRNCLVGYIEYQDRKIRGLELNIKGYEADMRGTMAALQEVRAEKTSMERELTSLRAEVITWRVNATLAQHEAEADIDQADDHGYDRGYHQCMRDMFVHLLTWKIAHAGSGGVEVLDQMNIPVHASHLTLGEYLERQMDLYFTSPDNCGWDQDWTAES
jgi:hypothetical protein